MTKKGQVIVAAVFVLVIVALLGMIAASIFSGESVSAAKNLHGIQALNVAEGGMRFTIVTSLAADTDWSNNVDFGPVNLGPGTFSVNYVNRGTQECTVEVTGTVAGVSRTVQAKFKKTGGGLGSIADSYAIYMGGGSGAVIGNNSEVNGNVFVYGNLIMGGGTTITGDATATGTIIGGSVLGEEETYAAPPTTPPSLETSYYNAQINIANTTPTYTGNRTFSGPLSPDAYYVKGNVTLDTLTLTGITTIVATGTIICGNNKTIGDYFTAIASREIIVGNNSNIGESGLWYSDKSITIGNSGDIADVTSGAGTSFITPGNFVAGNTFASNGLIFAGQALVVGNNFDFTGLVVAHSVTIGNDAELSVNPNVINFDAVPGISAGSIGTEGSFDVTGWGEVY
ncbi:MAG: hypothetical protein WC632_00985 [Candidatus Margulisiibacteriota bacterium]